MILTLRFVASGLPSSMPVDTRRERPNASRRGSPVRIEARSREKETVMVITLSHGGPTMYRSPARSRHVLVGTIRGVVCMGRDDDGPGWHVAHRSLSDKHIHALLREPESGAIFAGANHGSVCASLDEVGTWEPRDHGLTEHDVYSLACSRLPEGTRIFAGTEPAHLFQSEDLGRHWAELPALRSGDTSRWSFPAPPHVAHTKHHRRTPPRPPDHVRRHGAGGSLETHRRGPDLPGDLGDGR